MIPDMDLTGKEKESVATQERMKVLIRILEEELTDLQRLTFKAYYFEKKSIPQIAAKRGVNKSTISRTLKRAEKKVRRYAKYYRI